MQRSFGLHQFFCYFVLALFLIKDGMLLFWSVVGDMWSKPKMRLSLDAFSCWDLLWWLDTPLERYHTEPSVIWGLVRSIPVHVKLEREQIPNVFMDWLKVQLDNGWDSSCMSSFDVLMVHFFCCAASRFGLISPLLGSGRGKFRHSLSSFQ